MKTKREKLELYTNVRNSAGVTAVNAKCVEELFEVSAEIDNAIDDVKTSGGISDFTYSKLVDEIADTIIMTEQVHGTETMTEDVKRVIEYKLDRLQTYLDDGKLMDNLDLTVLD